jgi:hypothetical protein
MRTQKKLMLVLAMITAFIATALLQPGLSGAGSLEPPASAVDGSGNPVPTTMTPPSWSQVLPDDERFELVMDGAAVLDNETGLVWEQSPDTIAANWSDANRYCRTRLLSRRSGWRLPSIEELASLVEVGKLGGLPNGHPFNNVLESNYWSSSTVESNSALAYAIYMRYGNNTTYDKSLALYWWCVRGVQ